MRPGAFIPSTENANLLKKSKKDLSSDLGKEFHAVSLLLKLLNSKFPVKLFKFGTSVIDRVNGDCAAMGGR
jgi:hypothetical protein